MNTTAIDHVCLLVSDLTAAKVYYEDVLRVTCRLHPGAEKTLMVENEQVHFFLKEVDAPREFLRLQHLSLAVDDLEPVAAMLDARGIAYERGRFEGFAHRNYDWLEWRDPDGIRLECVVCF
ncbi:MAG: VOC family protein [Chloroflexota bacterium]